MGHHFPFFNRLPCCSTWALKSLLFQLTPCALKDRTTLASQISSPFSWSTQLGKRPNTILLQFRQRELGPPSHPPINLYCLPLDKEELLGWEAQGSRGSVPSLELHPFSYPQ